MLGAECRIMNFGVPRSSRIEHQASRKKTNLAGKDDLPRQVQ
jgi:hypothetical protein